MGQGYYCLINWHFFQEYKDSTDSLHLYIKKGYNLEKGSQNDKKYVSNFF